MKRGGEWEWEGGGGGWEGEGGMTGEILAGFVSIYQYREIHSSAYRSTQFHRGGGGGNSKWAGEILKWRGKANIMLINR